LKRSLFNFSIWIEVPKHSEQVNKQTNKDLSETRSFLMKIYSASEQSLVFLYSIGSLNGCLSVHHFYISSLSFDARRKKIGASDRGDPCQKFCVQDFWMFVLELISNFAVFSMNFDARKNKVCASDRVIPCQDFLCLPDF